LRCRTPNAIRKTAALSFGSAMLGQAPGQPLQIARYLSTAFAHGNPPRLKTEKDTRTLHA
ncbi:MAG: hypothetical protein QGG53_28605, partial [Planctomycetota bacterium]|nr:hypothetical protein [Planctomycetota bacterium]